MTGNQLKRVLEANRVAKAKLARAIGVTPQTITGYCKLKNVSTATLESFCEGLGVDISYFYAGTPYGVPVEKCAAAFDTEDSALRALIEQYGKQLEAKDRQIAELSSIIKNLSALCPIPQRK